ncbi:MAG TPA: Gfo/Idh/MocA family oxidoreductase [Terriglobia bacterium]|nr:Gfo/Idh/MocA family oxidoreductase [Terriglobia bacterium]
MVQNTNGGWSRPRAFLALTLLVFVVYNSNFRWLLSRDSIPARVLPLSLLLDGHLYVDDWVAPYQQGQFARGAYYVTSARGHLYSVYPIIEPLVITPLYAIPAWWLSRQHPQYAKGSFVLTTIIESMEKLSASLMAALSVGLLFLALRNYTSSGTSLIITLVYALTCNTWAISSQSLWRHGLTELSFALLLWALSKNLDESGGPFWAGLALAMATANKPAYVLLVLPFLIYMARSHRKKLNVFFFPLAVIGMAVLSYNFYFFGRILGAYPNPLGPMTVPGGPLTPIHIPWWDGLAGLLISPNRGLFIYTPWTVFALWGAARVWKENFQGWGRYLLPGMATVYLVHAQLGLWWGGGCFGPRYLTDLLPLLAFFLIPIWPRIRSSHITSAIFALCVVFSLWVQIIGAYYYPNGNWDSTPTTVEADPRRVWDWSDTQLLRTWRAGPARLEILDEAGTFFQAVSFESSQPAVRLAIIGLDNDRVWGLLKDIAREPAAELVAIADSNPELVARARAQIPSKVRFYDDYVKMLDDIKPAAVIVTTAPDHHLEILRECARRHIDFSTEEPISLTAKDAREMESVARAARIKLMVNYANVWVGSSQEMFGRVAGGTIGPVQKIDVRYGHVRPKETGKSKNDASWRNDPARGGGALMDFGCYGAEWALWLKGRPSSVFAYSLNLKRGNSESADDDDVILLKYPDGTATIQASHDWPFNQGEVEAFGPKGSLLATRDALYFRAARSKAEVGYLDGRAIALPTVLHETSSAVAYFIYHIRHDQPIEDPVSARMNVQAAEILDAAKESIRTGAAVELPRQ